MTWNKDSNIADDEIRVVRFDFDTNKGPGTVTTIVNKGVTIDSAKRTLLEALDDLDITYETMEITGYEILEILPSDDDSEPKH